MKGYDLVGKYKYELLSKKKKKLGNRSKIYNMVKNHARILRKKNKWIRVTENKKEGTFSVYV